MQVLFGPRPARWSALSGTSRASWLAVRFVGDAAELTARPSEGRPHRRNTRARTSQRAGARDAVRRPEASPPPARSCTYGLAATNEAARAGDEMIPSSGDSARLGLSADVANSSDTLGNPPRSRLPLDVRSRSESPPFGRSAHVGDWRHARDARGRKIAGRGGRFTGAPWLRSSAEVPEDRR